MNAMRLAILCYVLAAGGLLVYDLTQLPRLPDLVASHFDGAGRPDGWSSRAAFVRTTWSMHGLLVLVFPGAAVLVLRVPARLINVPRPEVWLASDRIATTRRTIAAALLCMGAFMLVFLLYLQHQTMRVNLGEIGGLGGMVVGIAVYLVATGAGTIWLLRRFGRP